MAIERTFIMIKPDAVQDGYSGAILKRIEEEENIPFRKSNSFSRKRMVCNGNHSD